MTTVGTTAGTSSPSTSSVRQPGTADEPLASGQLLRHVMVVGGTLDDWERTSPDGWDQLVDRLGSIAGRAGASYLTLRPYEEGRDPAALRRWERQVGACHVTIDPSGDGRQRFADALSHLPAAEPVTQATITENLYAPADCEPDLIVVLGEPTHLPPSLVWELAYGELVFVARSWQQLDADDLLDAIADFATRERRFGGLDL
jgi:Putative undecaprenyl diphosphate synthase